MVSTIMGVADTYLNELFEREGQKDSQEDYKKNVSGIMGDTKGDLKSGKRQSPIAIPFNHKEHIKVVQQPLEFKLEYGASIISVDANLTSYVQQGHDVAKIDGKTYKLISYHFKSPSEHSIVNQHQDAELQLVHKLIENDKEIEQFAIISVLLHVGQTLTDYPGLQLVLDCYEQNMKPEIQQDTQDESAMVNLKNDLLSTDMIVGKTRIASYAGSLTYLPYTENAVWYVLLDQSIEITKVQKQKLRQILEKHNNREQQDLAGREVYIFHK